MERKTEREWKSVLCPSERQRTSVMCEWDIVSVKGRILKRTLRRIDCFSPKLAEFGGTDCNWVCAGVMRKRER